MSLLTLIVQLRIILGRTGDNQRRPGASSIRIESTSSTIGVAEGRAEPYRPELELHIVAQIVEAEFVVRAIGDVGSVILGAVLVFQTVDDDAEAEAEEL